MVITGCGSTDSGLHSGRELSVTGCQRQSQAVRACFDGLHSEL